MQAHAHATRPSDYAYDAVDQDGPGAPAAGLDAAAVAPRPDTARTLTILGLSSTGDHVVCADTNHADTDSGRAAQTFTIAIDDRLRAAVRGNLGRVVDGEREIEMAPQLRPREIQSRIRAGASVEQVAAAAGCPVERIEGYAYPVLLERATIAERSRAAQPLADDSRTLEEIAVQTLTDRGQQQSAQWDAFKDERGWTVTLTWQAGRSENRAEWAFVARAVGGTVTPRNSEASDLIAPVYSPPRAAPTAPTGYDVILGAGPASRAQTPGDRPSQAAPHAGAARDGADGPQSTAHSTAARPADPARETAERRPEPTTQQRVDQPAGSPRGGSKRSHRPQMPSWEDVLLGTRTADH